MEKTPKISDPLHPGRRHSNMSDDFDDFEDSSRVVRFDPDEPVVRKKVAPVIVRKPHIARMLYDAYNVIHKELATLHKKTANGEELSIAEAKKFQIYAQQLSALAKEEREQIRQDKLEDLDDQQLLEKAREAQKILELPED